MSWRAYSLVWERTRAKGSNLLMMLAVADYAKDDGRWAWPSARTLTWKSRLTGRGGELVLTRLVSDGELWPEWHERERRFYLHIRCIFDWEVYKTEGPLPMHSEKISRKQSENFSRKLVALAVRKANERAAKANGGAAKANGGGISLCSGSEGDPSKTEVQGLRPDHRPVQPVENPEDNIAVITRIVHEVLDNFAQADDVTEGDVVEAVKRHCAVLDIAYRSDVVWRALESAWVQRGRKGKPRFGTG